MHNRLDDGIQNENELDLSFNSNSNSLINTPTENNVSQPLLPESSSIQSDHITTINLNDLKCPITHELFFNPVTVVYCGHSFEEEAINNWKTINDSCPCCRKEIKSLTPSRLLKDLVARTIHCHPELLSDKYLSSNLLTSIIKAGKEDYQLITLIMEKNFHLAAAGAFAERGEYHWVRNNFTRAISDCSLAIFLNPTLAGAYFTRAKAQDDTENYDAAIADYEETLKLNPTIANLKTFAAGAYIKRADTKRHLDNFSGAIADCNIAINLNPLSEKAYYSRAKTKQKAEDFEGAISDYKEVQRLNPYFHLNDHLELAYIDNAHYKLNLVEDNLDEVIENCNEALKLNPDSIQAYSIRAKAKIHKGDDDGAIVDCTLLIDKQPRNYKFYATRAKAYMHKKDFDKAIADFDKAIELHTSVLKYYGLRAAAKYLKNDIDGAIADATEIIIRPPDPNSESFTTPTKLTAYTIRAQFKLAKHDFNGALDDCKAALRYKNEGDANDIYLTRFLYLESIIEMKKMLEEHTLEKDVDPNSTNNSSTSNEVITNPPNKMKRKYPHPMDKTQPSLQSISDGFFNSGRNLRDRKKQKTDENALTTNYNAQGI